MAARTGNHKMADLPCLIEFFRQGLFIFNFGTFFVGALVIAVGAIAIESLQVILEIGGGAIEAIGAVIICLGILLLIMGFFGCCGAIRESRRMLLTFFYIIITVFLIEVVIVVLVLVYRSQLEPGGQVFEFLVEQWQELAADASTASEILGLVQIDFECCGAQGLSDWSDIYSTANNGQPNNYGIEFPVTTPFPPSCCNETLIQLQKTSTIFCNSDPDFLYQNGCIVGVTSLLEENLLFVGVTLGIIGGLQIAAMITSKLLIGKLEEVGKMRGGKGSPSN